MFVVIKLFVVVTAVVDRLACHGAIVTRRLTKSLQLFHTVAGGRIAEFAREISSFAWKAPPFIFEGIFAVPGRLGCLSVCGTKLRQDGCWFCTDPFTIFAWNISLVLYVTLCVTHTCISLLFHTC